MRARACDAGEVFTAVRPTTGEDVTLVLPSSRMVVLERSVRVVSRRLISPRMRQLPLALRKMVVRFPRP